MKKLAIRFLILTFIWILFLSLFYTTQTFAATDGLEISTTANKELYDVGDEIQIKIKTNKKVMTASFYLNYDSSVISYNSSKTASVAAKDYPSDNLVRVVYAGNGTDEIILSFKVKNNNKQTIDCYFTNATMTVAGRKTYKQNEISGIGNKLKITIKTDEVVIPTPTPQPTTTKDTTVAKTTIPKTGESYLGLIVIVAIIISAFIGLKYKTYKKIL